MEKSSFVSDAEMAEILADKRLMRDLRRAEKEIKAGKYRIVKSPSTKRSV